MTILINIVCKFRLNIMFRSKQHATYFLALVQIENLNLNFLCLGKKAYIGTVRQKTHFK